VQLSARIIAAANEMRGGDWCEAFVVGDGVIALSIGDVCGHGKTKYAAMIAIRRAIHDASRRGLDPSRVLAEAHRFLRGYDRDEYATAFLGYFHVEQRRLDFANAGHPPPLVCSAEGATYLEYPEYDLPLGIEDTHVPVLRTIDIPDASLLVLYSDGVTEHDRKPLNGEAELRDAAIFAYNFAAVPTAGIIEQRMNLGGLNHDDVAILTALTPRSLRVSARERHVLANA
jgi:serine phosphatase RsbU (regulator of sigma subunit)